MREQEIQKIRRELQRVKNVVAALSAVDDGLNVLSLDTVPTSHRERELHNAWVLVYNAHKAVQDVVSAGRAIDLLLAKIIAESAVAVAG